MAIQDVIEEFSSVDEQSKCFKSDVLQFLNSKRSLKATRELSTAILTEVKCCTQSLLISFCHRDNDFVELISKGDLQFICSASLINDSLETLDLGFSTLVFCSPRDSVLAKCTSRSFSTVVLGIRFSKSDDHMNELSLCLSSLDIWLHLSEWTEVVKFLNCLYLRLEKFPMDAASETLSVETAISVQEAAVKNASCFLDTESTSVPCMTQDIENSVLMIIRSENVCITFHIPIWTSEKPYMEFQHAECLKPATLSVSSDIVVQKDAEFLTISIKVNDVELVTRGMDIQLKANMDRLSSVIMLVANESHTSWPLLDIIQVHLDAVLSKSLTNNIELKVEVICDHSDVWLSHPAFHLWSAVKFEVPKSGSSQYSTRGISFKFQMRKVSILLPDEKV